jgi:Ca-activated chloride channel family protein
LAALCHGTERIEIVLDASMGMWDSFPSGTPLIVTARTAINSIAVSPAVRDLKLEIGLRTIGGRSEISEGSGCGDSESVVATGPVDPPQWSSALADLDPRGGRALVHAVEEAAEHLAGGDGEGRIVVITSGPDQCHRDLKVLLDTLSREDNPIPVRIIGLDIDQALASSLILSTPTRNVSNPAKLLENLRWAMLPAEIASTRPEWLELQLTAGKEPVDGATLHMVVDPLNGEETSTTIEHGGARIQIPPGRYRARIEGLNFRHAELSDVVHLGDEKTLEISLAKTPVVTLEVDPERPLAGGEAHIQYWGAPVGSNWVAVTIAGAPIGEFLMRSSAPGPAGEVTLRLPDSPNELEVQFTQDIGSGIHQLLGRIAFESGRRRISIEAPKRIENQTQMNITWSGAELPGDYITIAPPGSDIAESVLCVLAVGGEPVEATAPAIAGDYVVRYFSRTGRTLARSNLEVFEVLATLEGPTEIAPGENFTVSWMGPDATHDYVSIADVGDSDEHYVTFSPTSNGNPAHLTAPKTAGAYELRYVRAMDGEVLAREALSVVAAEITLDVPPVVEAGTRFEVAWSGTAGEGDFIAIARVRSDPKKHLDWSYTDLGSPVTLAAPFDAGRYLVRYVSGGSQKIVARASIEVR